MKILTLDEIAKQTPAAVAQKAKPGLSSSYAFMSTSEAIRIHADMGWFPVAARQINSRQKENIPYTRHQIIFRRPGDIAISELGYVLPEIRLVNNHTGRSSFRVFIGLMRLVCSNGMVAPSASMGEVRLRHTARKAMDLRRQLESLSARIPRLMEVAQKWRNIILSQVQAVALAGGALGARFGGNEVKWPATREALVYAVRRTADESNDLWSIFNRIQENILKGGKEIVGKLNSKGQRRRIVSIHGIDQEIRVNQELWLLAEQMALVA